MTTTLLNAPTFWSATELRTRKEIVKAFETKSKNQWLIGDLLNNIKSLDNAEFSRKLLSIADENKVSVRTIRTYRQVAASYPDSSERPNFTVARDLVRAVDAKNKDRAKAGKKSKLDAPTEYKKMVNAGKKVTVDSIATEFSREIPSRPKTDTADGIVRACVQMIAKLEGKRLSEGTKTQLRFLRLSIDVLLDS